VQRTTLAGLHCLQANGWKIVTTTNMAIIFFIFGLTTDTSELVMAVKAGKSLVFGLLSILFISPLLGFICMLIPFKPYEFALGLAVMACVPTSLSSGVTLVIGAYGNGALALLFTVSANILGIITSPLMVKLVLGSVTDAHVDTADLLVKLGVSILMPVLVGKGLREAVKPLRDNIYKFKAPLYLMNNLQVSAAGLTQGISSSNSTAAVAVCTVCSNCSSRLPPISNTLPVWPC
jgi:sodium/bile acid cotransporter 7